MTTHKRTPVLTQAVVPALATLLSAGCAGTATTLAPQAGPPFAAGLGAQASRVAAGSPEYATVYAFKGEPDGTNPESDLLPFRGKFYGTTASGGKTNHGAVFEVGAKGKERVVYSFKGGMDGAQPQGGLIAVAGTLYGTTTYGGLGSGLGNGVVYAVTPSGKERVVYRFAGGGTDGQNPFGDLVELNGILYGTTEFGGGPTGGGGGVYSLTPSGTEHVVYAFKDQPDGAYPLAGLTVVDGALYGTTAGGGRLYGTIFKVATSGNEQVLYTFKGHLDGVTPAAPLLYFGSELYGTTVFGGSRDPSIYNGTVFKVSPTGRERVIYRFKPSGDGASPQSGLTVVDGLLYGTTYFGGNSSGTSHGDGTIYSVSTAGVEHIVHVFQGGAAGGNPAAGMLLVDGVLYGTTSEQGLSQPTGKGTVFAFTP